MVSREDSRDLEIALSHTWQWFALHAGQRMQAMNFFLIAVAFIAAGLIGAVRAGFFGISLIVGLVGLMLSGGFYLLEVRTRQLVKIGETALRPLQNKLSEITDIHDLRFLELADIPPFRGAKYSVAFNVVYVAVTAAFIITSVFSASKL